MGNKSIGTSIIFINKNNEVLLFLRDNINSIPFPNRWDILGGHLEGNETPEECIIREMYEEIEIRLKKPKLFKKYELEDRIEFTFWRKANFDINRVKLNEGQRLKWFSEKEIIEMPDDRIAFNFKEILLEFFNHLSSNSISIL